MPKTGSSTYIALPSSTVATVPDPRLSQPFDSPNITLATSVFPGPIGTSPLKSLRTWYGPFGIHFGPRCSTRRGDVATVQGDCGIASVAIATQHGNGSRGK
jgi:hypothetical protein